MKPIILTRAEGAALDALNTDQIRDPVALVRNAGLDPANFFEFGRWTGGDFTRSDISWVSFRGANLHGAAFRPDQIPVVMETNPRRGPCDDIMVDEIDPDALEAFLEARRRIAIAKANEHQKLNLTIVALERLPPEIATLTSLKTLNLSSTKVEDISHLAAMTGIQTLDLSNTQVEDISHLAAMTGMLRLILVSTNADLHQLVAEGAAWAEEDLALSVLAFINTPATRKGECLNGLYDINYSDKGRTKAALARLRELRNIAELGDDFDSDLTSPEAIGAFKEARRRIADAKKSGTKKLDLRVRSLDRLPPEIADLRKLTKLRLSNTRVADITHLEGMVRLRRLDLNGTQVADISHLAGMVGMHRLRLNSTSVKDISSLAGMVCMKELNLNNSQVSDISPLAGIMQIQRLHLSNSKVADISALAGMVEMQRLDINNTQVADISPLSEMVRLQELRLNETQVVDITPLSGTVKMQALDLSNTQVEDISHLAAMTGIQTLDLSNTKVEDISPLAAMTGIQTLDLSNTKVEDISPLAAMTGLQTLNLNSTQVGGVSPLAVMTGMQTLYLGGTKVEDISHLAAMTGLQTLNLNYTLVDLGQLVAEGAAWAENDHELKDLRVYSVQVEDVILVKLAEQSAIHPVGAETLARLRELRDMAELGVDFDSDPMSPEALAAFNEARRRIAEAKTSGATELDLRINGLDRLPPQIAGLSDLEELWLSGTEIGDISQLTPMVEMRLLDLTDTPVADISPLAGMVKIQQLWLSGTKVTGVASLEGMVGMKELHLQNTQVADISPLAGMDWMQALYLGNTMVKDVTPLSRMVWIKRLHLGDTHVVDLTTLARMMRMKWLNLSGTKIADITPLAYMIEMQELCVDGTQVDLSVLVAPGAVWENHDYELKTITLKGVPIEDEVLATLAEQSSSKSVGPETLARLRELRDMAELGDDFEGGILRTENLQMICDDQMENISDLKSGAMTFFNNGEPTVMVEPYEIALKKDRLEISELNACFSPIYRLLEPLKNSDYHQWSVLHGRFIETHEELISELRTLIENGST